MNAQHAGDSNDRYGYLVSQSATADMLEDMSPQERYQKRMTRKKKIITAAKVGITVCVICALIKYIIGIMSNSLAIESDAISSLTESYSYIVSWLGIALAHKRPTKKHPNGFGRIEFITAIIGGVFVIVAGWHYFESSIERIAAPEMSTVTNTQLLIVAVTILGKMYLFKDDGKVGRTYNSSGLITASRNAFLSSMASVLVIISALVSQKFGVDIDGWVGLIISIFMLVTGVIGIKNGLSPLLGTPIKKETADAVTQILLSHPPIVGVYDLKIVNTGAGITRGTVNAEVPEDANAEEIYEAFRSCRNEIYRKLGIDLTIGLITVNYCNKDVHPVFNKINEKVSKLKGVENVHGFNWNKDTNEVDLHVVIDYDHLNDEQLREDIQKIVQGEIPNSSALIDFNVNYQEDKGVNKAPSCTVG